MPIENGYILAWDPYEIAKGQAEFLLEEYPEEYDEDTAFRAACEDSDIYDSEWECLVDALTEEMQKRNPDGHWYVEVCNFGWRGVNGHKFMSADDGKDFLQQILPQTDCTFYIYEHGKHGFMINNFHHDSPVGKEFYFALPAIACDRCGDLMGQEAGITTPDGIFCEYCAEKED